MKNKYLEECRKDGGIVWINQNDERGYGFDEYAVENYSRPGTWINVFKKKESAIAYCARNGLKIKEM